MSDTRTIYLLTQDNIYCSDPKIKQSSDLPVTYLDMSEFDNLNPTRGTVVSGLAGAVSTYEPYDTTITLTFKNRQERAEWIQKNGEQVYQIAVANTINQNRVYNKKCAITSFEFVENPYTNGIQTVLTLKLFGKWQSSLTEVEINSGTYSGGTKSYTRDIQIRDTDDGADGADGVAGEPEEDGRVPYTHTAYSWSADGTDRFTTVYPGRNLIVQSGLKLGFLNRDDGGVTTLTSYNFYLDNYIPTNGATVFTLSSPDYVFKGSANNTLGMYNGDKKFLGWQNITSPIQTLSKPNVAYIRFSINFVNEGGTSGHLSDWLNSHRYKLETGTLATPYTPSPLDDPEGAYPKFIGTYTDYTAEDSTDPTVYTWSTPRVKKSYAYDSELRYGVTHYVSAIKLDGEHGFVFETEPRNGGLTVNLQSDYNGHQFALESNWPDLITGLSSDFVAYPFTSFATLDRFTMLAGGTVTSYGWNIENNEMPYLYEMFNNVEKYPVSVGAVNQNGTVIPIHVYTYTAQDFI